VILNETKASIKILLLQYLYSNFIGRVSYFISLHYKGGKRGEPRAPEGNVIKADDNLPDVKHRSAKGKGWKPGRLMLGGGGGHSLFAHMRYVPGSNK